jgi:hypothetical protein
LAPPSAFPAPNMNTYLLAFLADMRHSRFWVCEKKQER